MITEGWEKRDGETTAEWLDRRGREDHAEFQAEMSAMLTGKTIESWEAVFVRYALPDPIVLRFTDGTAVTISATGYETDGVLIDRMPL